MIKIKIYSLFACLMISSFVNVHATQPIENNVQQIQSSVQSLEDNQQDIHITAKSAIVMDLNSGQILYRKEEDMLRPPASITKVLTAIVAIENANLNDVVTISENAQGVEGSSTYIEEGEQITLSQLLYGLMLQSGNDSAIAIAEHVGGSKERFVEMMNETAKRAGVEHSHFANPHGLDDPEHNVTAKDMALITQYAMKNETFRDIFGTVEYDWKSKGWQVLLHNKHRIIKGEILFDGVTGGKTGYTSKAGQTLVTTAKRGNTELVAVVLSSEGKNVWYDTTKILEHGFENYKTVLLGKKGLRIPFLKAKNQEKKEYTLEESFYYTLSKNEYDTLAQKYNTIENAIERKIVEEEDKNLLRFYVNHEVVKEKAIDLPKEAMKQSIKQEDTQEVKKNPFFIRKVFNGFLYSFLGFTFIVFIRIRQLKKRRRKRLFSKRRKYKF